MGIPTLWDMLRSGFDPRVSIDELSAVFLQENGRPIRLAIDAYMFIFKSTVNLSSNSLDDESTHPWIINNFISKVMYLVSLNISFVLVFDGIWKPRKLRHNESVLEQHYNSDLQAFLNSGGEYYKENSALVDSIMERLTDLNIDYVQAPGEGEAQCAYWQKTGVFDFVLSDDADTLVFGATAVLRNFSRYQDDIRPSPKKKEETALSVTSKFYVTPVRLERVISETGLTTSRLVFLASLGGGDYSKGVEKIGVTNATKLALCGTGHAEFYHRKLLKLELKKSPTKRRSPLPDFSEQLVRCFTNSPNEKNWGRYDSILPESTRKKNLTMFLERLNDSIKTSPRDIFGRLVTFSQDLVFDEYFSLMYFYPFVKTEKFDFKNSFSFGENQRMILPTEIKFNCKDQDLGDGKEGPNGEVSCPRSDLLFDNLFIPKNFNLRVKAIVAKLLTHRDIDPPLNEMLSITRSKMIGDVEHVMVRYNVNKVAQIYPRIYDVQRNALAQEQKKEFTEEPDPLSSSPSKLKQEYVWLPKVLVEKANRDMVRTFESQSPSSPSKKNAMLTQKTTLDSMGSFSLSPVKSTLSSPRRNVSASPTRRQSPKKNTGKLLPGQQNIMRFFETQSPPRKALFSDGINSEADQEDPFLEKPVGGSLFVDSEEDENESEHTNFESIKKSFKDAPLLSSEHQRKRSTSTDHSPPTKRAQIVPKHAGNDSINRDALRGSSSREYIYVDSDQSMDASIVEIDPP